MEQSKVELFKQKTDEGMRLQLEALDLLIEEAEQLTREQDALRDELKKAANLYKAANAIADQIMEEQGFGAEYDEDGLLEVKLNKAEVEEFISVILNWDK